MASNNGKPLSSFASRGLLGLWIILFVIWMIANASLAFEPALAGLVIAFVIAHVFVSSSEAWQSLRLTPRALYHFVAYSVTFVVELVRANLNVMALVYAPRIDIKPGIVKVRTRLETPLGRLALANSIALTPGSLVIDIRDDILFVHWLDVKTTDIDEATKALATPFEKHLEKVFG
ncbi:Na+/H+ antiporter subunit E [Paraburkholderia sp. MMS20-SJTN17]|uniref:Na+/H+ antiporter subunit E n=1 Tax=Paraburkholderia translucens TaxID=2886945 RepID=A0ABS8KD07_9BURK|nr:Na+/H+ antiporter subunit E [Paraburkholderia sp. MMS20-SJTN17]MCC8402651.1 Na+/H+ antiporter subunit E [Paraburkholderia sp. MMS20-SJTN17]